MQRVCFGGKFASKKTDERFVLSSRIGVWQDIFPFPKCGVRFLFDKHSSLCYNR